LGKLCFAVGRHGILDIFATERTGTRQHLIQNHTEREAVRDFSVPLALQNLRRDVPRRAAATGHLLLVPDAGREPEVTQVRLPVAVLPSLDKDVGQLDVAVANLPGVRVLDGAEDLRHQDASFGLR
jgi:hypothetical protein